MRTSHGSDGAKFTVPDPPSALKSSRSVERNTRHSDRSVPDLVTITVRPATLTDPTAGIAPGLLFGHAICSSFVPYCTRESTVMKPFWLIACHGHPEGAITQKYAEPSPEPMWSV